MNKFMYEYMLTNLQKLLHSCQINNAAKWVYMICGFVSQNKGSWILHEWVTFCPELILTFSRQALRNSLGKNTLALLTTIRQARTAGWPDGKVMKMDTMAY